MYCFVELSLCVCSTLQNAEYVSDLCRKEGGVATASLRPLLSESQKLRKCIMELIDTERQYVKVKYMKVQKNNIKI